MNVTDVIAKARSNQDPQSLIQHIPYARALGMDVGIEDGQLVGELPFDQHLIGDLGAAALHGGSIGGFLESTAIVTLLWEIEETQTPKTINLTVEYLSSGRPKTTFARAEITRHGRRVAKVRAVAWQDDPETPIAAAYAHFLLVPASQ